MIAEGSAKLASVPSGGGGGGGAAAASGGAPAAAAVEEKKEEKVEEKVCWHTFPFKNIPLSVNVYRRSPMMTWASVCSIDLLHYLLRTKMYMLYFYTNQQSSPESSDHRH